MTAPAPSLIRETRVTAASTDTFGRVMCSARNHHFVIDGPVPNGCPGEAITPPEAFLAAVASCGVELAQVIGKEDGLNVTRVGASIYGKVDRGNPVRPDVTLFNEVRIAFTIEGPTPQESASIVEKFKKR
ncbi:MAG: OsmC family protein [Gemmatimonadetes bacterium]|nr:OsmC family protein [Gemmatimonadota bacterium]